MGLGDQHHVPVCLPAEKENRHPLCRRLNGPQGRSGRVRKVSPPTGLRSPDRPARSDCDTPAHSIKWCFGIRGALYRKKYFWFLVLKGCWSILILSPHPRLDLPSGLFPSGFPRQNPVCISLLPPPTRATYTLINSSESSDSVESCSVCTYISSSYVSCILSSLGLWSIRSLPATNTHCTADRCIPLCVPPPFHYLVFFFTLALFVVLLCWNRYFHPQGK